MAKLRSDKDIKLIIKETISELLEDEQFIERIVDKVSDKIQEKLQNVECRIKTLEAKMYLLEDNIIKLQQKEKANNVCVYGLSEKEKEQEHLLGYVIKTLNNKNTLNIKEEDILSCYRIGNPKLKKDKPRPVIIKFNKYELKQFLLKNTKTFKGQKLFLTEDLVSVRRNLLKEAQTKLGFKNVWPRNGFIFASYGGKTIKLNSIDDIRPLE